MTDKNDSFESSFKELEALVKKLESGRVSLEETIEAYEEGQKLKKICEERLAKAKLKIEKMMAQ